MSATSAGGEAISETALRFACMASTGVDRTRLTEICADFLGVLETQPGFTVAGSQDTALTTGPGLEISVTRATDTQLELTPTWVDQTGKRTTLPSTGFVIMDAAMTKTMRRDLFLRVLATPPK